MKIPTRPNDVKITVLDSGTGGTAVLIAYVSTSASIIISLPRSS